jgi:hypothetical protein
LNTVRPQPVAVLVQKPYPDFGEAATEGAVGVAALDPVTAIAHARFDYDRREIAAGDGDLLRLPAAIEINMHRIDQKQARRALGQSAVFPPTFLVFLR